MKFHPQDLADNIIYKIRDNSNFVKIVIIPAIIFFFDLVLRSILNVDLTDAGADMALLGFNIFISLIIDGSQKDHILAKIIFIIISILFWIICLKIVSLDSMQLLSPFISYDFREVFCWFLGLIAFIFSSIFADSLIRNSNKQGTNL